MRKIEGLTPLVAPMYRDDNGRLRPDPPGVAVLGRGFPSPPTEESLGRISSLGGDYPNLVLHLMEFYERADHGPDFDRWTPRLVFALAPTLSDETRGMIGTFGANRACRVTLVASRQQARAVLRAACDFGPFVAERAAASLPYFERSVLPESSEDPAVDLDPALATWLVGWYALYSYETKQIR